MQPLERGFGHQTQRNQFTTNRLDKQVTGVASESALGRIKSSFSQQSWQLIQQEAAYTLYNENGGKPYISTTLRHFANMQASTILRGSELEGGLSIDDTIVYWMQLFERWKHEADLVNHGLSDKEIRRVEQSLQDCLDFQDEFRSKDPVRVIQLVQEKLAQQGICYLPVGWKGLPGHFMLAKLQLKGGQVVVELLTKGGGSEYHDIVQQGVSKLKSGYKSDAYTLDQETFFNSKVGVSFFKRLMDMRDRSVKFANTAADLDGGDLYGLFQLLADASGQPVQASASIGVTTQRAGTCVDTGLRMTLYEAIFESDPSRTSMNLKRSMYAQKFYVLVDGFRQFRDLLEKGDKDACLYLEHAVQEHLTRLVKLYPEVLTLEEVAKGLAIGEEIQAKVLAGKEKIRQQTAPVIIPELRNSSLSQKAPPAPSISFDEFSSSSKTVEITTLPRFSLEPPKPSEVVATMGLWVKQFKEVIAQDESKSFHPEIFQHVALLLSTLPISSGEASDPYWDKVPRAQRAACIKNLTELAILANLTVPTQGQEALLFTANSRAYDIACQIAISIPELKLKNFGFYWAYHYQLYDSRWDRLSFYHDARDLEAIKKIQANFDKRNQKEGAELFPLVLTNKENNWYLATPHWRYLNQFYTQDIKKAVYERSEQLKRDQTASKRDDEDFFFRKRAARIPTPDELFVQDDERKYFPEPFYDLQTLAYFSYPLPSKNRENIRRAITAGDLWKECSYKPNQLGEMQLPLERKEAWIAPSLRNGSTALYSFVRCTKEREPSENDVLIKKPQLELYNDQSKLSKKTLEELALIPTCKNRQIAATFEWGLSNLRLLRDPAVQGCIEEYLFQYGLLTEALERDHDTTIHRINDFLLIALDSYLKNPSETPTVLWLINLGVRLESYIRCAPHDGKRAVLPDFHSIVLEMISRESDPQQKIALLDHAMVTFGAYESEELTGMAIASLLSAKFSKQLLQGHNRTNTSHPVATEALHVFYSHRDHIFQLLIGASPEVRDPILNTLLANVLNQPISQNHWKVLQTTPCKFTDGQYVLDLDACRIFKNGVLMRDLAASAANSRNYQTIFREEPFIYVERDGYYYKQPTEQARIINCLPNQDFRIQKRITINGSESWMEYEPRPAVNLRDLPIPNPLKADSYQFWRSCDEPFTVAIVDKQSGQVCYQYQSPEGWIRLDEQAKPSNERIVNLLSPGSPRQDWIRFLGHFEPVEEVVLKEVRGEDGSWSISELEFPRLKLSFTAMLIDGKFRLKSNQFEGYYICPQIDNDPLKGLQGVFVLEDITGKNRMSIIPAKGILETAPKRENPEPQSDFGLKGLSDLREYSEKEAERMSDEEEMISEGSSLPIGFDHSKILVKDGNPFYIYHHIAGNDPLKPETPQGALYLSLLMRDIGEHSTALRYLKKSEHMERNTSIDWQLVNNLVLDRRQIHMPALAAYDLHLALRMEAHKGKHTKESFKKNSVEDAETMKIEKYFDAYTKRRKEYLDACSSDLKEDVIALSADLRLSPQQQLSLHKLEGIPVKKDIRAALAPLKSPDFYKYEQDYSEWLKSTGIEHIASRRPRDGDAMQADIVRLLDSSSCKTPEAYVSTYFFELYNRACSSDPDERLLLKLDLFFLSRHVANEKPEKLKDLHFWIGTLAFIADHPHDFKPMTCSTSDYSDRKKEFEAILRNCSNLQQGESRASKKQASSSLKGPANYVKPISTQRQLPGISVTIEGQLPDLMRRERVPFETLCNKYYEIREVSVQEAAASFPLEGRKAKSPLAQTILDQLHEGHELNQGSVRKHFNMRNLSQVNELREILEAELKTNELQLLQLTKQVEVSANKLPEGDVLEKAKLLGKQSKTLKLSEPLLSCFLTQDAGTLLEWNPNLSASDILQLFKDAAELFAVGRRIKTAEEALSLSERIEKASLEEERNSLIDQQGALLSAETAYDIDRHPEYLVYEYATGMMLRSDQVKLLDWIFASLDKPELEHLLFQFQAGGGKTKVLMPIIAFKLAQRGALPVLINYTSRYEIGKRDLDRSLSAGFGQNLEVLEIELGTELTAEKVRVILDDLRGFLKGKKALTVKSETINSLIIARKRAFKDQNSALIQAINSLFEFFNQSCAALIDEAHLTLEALQETNQTTSQSEPFPEEYRNLLMDLIYTLAGSGDQVEVETSDGKIPIQNKVRLLQNQQALLTDNDIGAMRNALANAIVARRPFVDIPQFVSGDMPQLILQYLQAPLGQEPSWLSALWKSDQQTANIVVLAKQFLHQIMPHILHLIQSIDYGESIHPEDFTCAPRHDKKPVTSKFQDVMITAALTIQNLIQSGLSEAGMKVFMEQLITQHEAEKELLEPPNELTHAQAMFNQWFGDNVSLDAFNAARDADIRMAMEKISHNPQVIELFLNQIALPQIRIHHEKLSATPPELLATFGKTIAFTATPGPLELYPHQLQHKDSAKLDQGFEASVLQVLCQPENRIITPVDFESLPQLFEEIYLQDPDSFKRITSLVDSGGLFRWSTNHDVVKAFLDFAKAKGIHRDGAIYNKATGIEEGSLALLQVEDERINSQALIGSDLPRALKQIGKNFNDLLLLTLFGLEDTTGADYKQPDKGRALLTVGEGQTKTSTIQAAMRMRRLLLGANGQTINWVISKELAQQIPKQQLDHMTVQDLFMWMIDNEAKVLEKAIVMRAYQGIRYLVQAISWNDILSQPTTEQQIAKFNQYSSGLVDRIETNPYQSYRQMADEKTEVVLKRYALDCYKALGFEDDDLEQLQGKEREAYELILNQTQSLVPTIATGQKDLSGEMFQHQEEKAEQRSEQLADVEQLSSTSTAAMNPASEEEYYQKFDNIWDPEFLTDAFVIDPSNHHHRLKDKLDLDLIPSDIYGSDKFFDIVSSPETPLLRPIKYVLVIQEKNSRNQTVYKYVLCSQKGAAHYLNQLDGKSWQSKGFLNPHFDLYSVNRAKIKRKAVLINISGGVVKNGDTSLGLSKDEMQSLSDFPEFKKRLTLLAFLNGRIQNLSLLHEITSQWGDAQFEAVWKQILKMKIGERSPDYNMMQELRKMRKGGTARIQRPVVIKSSGEILVKPHRFRLRLITSIPKLQGRRSFLQRFFGS